MSTFQTPAPITAELNIPAGRVQLIAADCTDTVVEVRPTNPGKNRDTKTAAQTSVNYADGVLHVDVPIKNKLLGAAGSVEVTIQLPVSSRVTGKSAATELRVVGRLGDIHFDGVNGEAKIDEADSVTLTALASDVSVGRLHGSADISTLKGDIRIAEAHSGNVVVRTQMGDLTVDVAPGVSAALDAGTSYGRISNSLKNDGTTTLTIQATTSYGDITAGSR